MLTWKIYNIVPMQQGQHSKTWITFKRNLRIDWKFGSKLSVSISTEQCHKNNISESQNGPLRVLPLEILLFLKQTHRYPYASIPIHSPHRFWSVISSGLLR